MRQIIVKCERCTLLTFTLQKFLSHSFYGAFAAPEPSRWNTKQEYAILSSMKTTFEALGLSEKILAGVVDLGFTEPTPVQIEAIPLVLAGRDVVASAQTGTGKTAAFTLPLLQRIKNAKGKGPHALVITPTRELAQQIEQVASVVCAQTRQRAVIVTGGARFDRQIKGLQAGCDLLVATPGRLIDLMERHLVSLKTVRVLVLDEADRMLDMGFWPSVKRILAALPKKRQTLLFSATISPGLKSTIDAMLSNPAYVEIAHVGETADTVEERLCPVAQGQKTQLLKALVEKASPKRMLVFCRTKQRVDDVSRMLKNAGIRSDTMHADKHQKQRERALLRFREGKLQVLVATDVMSRGIDVSSIDVVVNYDVPLDPEDYVHRVGRTGRAGAAGFAYTFVAPDEISALREIEYFTKKLISVWDLPDFAYDINRLVPNPSRPTSKSARTMFSGSQGRGRGRIRTGGFGRQRS